MEVKVTNDRNELLTVEGNTNLPEGAVVEARLSQANGRRWALGRGYVIKGHYFVVLDINHSPGLEPLNLDVLFDPVSANTEVQRVVGARGEAMSGDLLIQAHDRTLISRRTRIILTMSAQDMALRRLQQGNGDIRELQSSLLRHPDDGESLIGLGLAYLKQRPSENHANSKAYQLLKQGIAARPASQALDMEARLWINRLNEKARRDAEERERLKAPSYSSRFVTENLIRPGQALGAFELGMTKQFLSLNFQLLPGNNNPTQFTIAAMPGIILTFDQTGKLIRATSNDKRFRTQERIGPGSDVEELLGILPSLQIEWQTAEMQSDQRMHRLATVNLKGMDLIIEQTYDPDLPLPDATIKQVEVYTRLP